MMINTEIPLAITNSLINGSHNLQLARSSFKVKHVCNSLSWLISITFSPPHAKFLTERVSSSELGKLMMEGAPWLASRIHLDGKWGYFQIK